MARKKTQTSIPTPTSSSSEDLSRYIYAGVDFETTGLDPHKNQVWEMAVTLADAEGNPGPSWRTFVRPTQPIPAEVQKLTGVRQGLINRRNSIEQSAAGQWLSEHVGNRTVVAHNAKFEAGFAHGLGLDDPRFQTKNMLDTLVLAQQVRGMGGKQSGVSNALDQLAQEFLGSSAAAAHRAQADVANMFGVLRHLGAQAATSPTYTLTGPGGTQLYSGAETAFVQHLRSRGEVRLEPVLAGAPAALQSGHGRREGGNPVEVQFNQALPKNRGAQMPTSTPRGLRIGESTLSAAQIQEQLQGGLASLAAKGIISNEQAGMFSGNGGNFLFATGEQAMPVSTDADFAQAATEGPTRGAFAMHLVSNLPKNEGNPGLYLRLKGGLSTGYERAGSGPEYAFQVLTEGGAEYTVANLLRAKMDFNDQGSITPKEIERLTPAEHLALLVTQSFKFSGGKAQSASDDYDDPNDVFSRLLTEGNPRAQNFNDRSSGGMLLTDPNNTDVNLGLRKRQAKDMGVVLDLAKGMFADQAIPMINQQLATGNLWFRNLQGLYEQETNPNLRAVQIFHDMDNVPWQPGQPRLEGSQGVDRATQFAKGVDPATGTALFTRGYLDKTGLPNLAKYVYGFNKTGLEGGSSEIAHPMAMVNGILIDREGVAPGRASVGNALTRPGYVRTTAVWNEDEPTEEVNAGTGFFVNQIPGSGSALVAPERFAPAPSELEGYYVRKNKTSRLESLTHGEDLLRDVEVPEFNEAGEVVSRPTRPSLSFNLSEGRKRNAGYVSELFTVAYPDSAKGANVAKAETYTNENSPYVVRGSTLSIPYLMDRNTGEFVKGLYSSDSNVISTNDLLARMRTSERYKGVTITQGAAEGVPVVTTEIRSQVGVGVKGWWGALKQGQRLGPQGLGVQVGDDAYGAAIQAGGTKKILVTDVSAESKSLPRTLMSGFAVMPRDQQMEMLQRLPGVGAATIGYAQSRGDQALGLNQLARAYATDLGRSEAEAGIYQPEQMFQAMLGTFLAASPEENAANLRQFGIGRVAGGVREGVSSESVRYSYMTEARGAVARQTNPDALTGIGRRKSLAGLSGDYLRANGSLDQSYLQEILPEAVWNQVKSDPGRQRGIAHYLDSQVDKRLQFTRRAGTDLYDTRQYLEGMVMPYGAPVRPELPGGVSLNYEKIVAGMTKYPELMLGLGVSSVDSPLANNDPAKNAWAGIMAAKMYRDTDRSVSGADMSRMDPSMRMVDIDKRVADYMGEVERGSNTVAAVADYGTRLEQAVRATQGYSQDWHMDENTILHYTNEATGYSDYAPSPKAIAGIDTSGLSEESVAKFPIQYLNMSEAMLRAAGGAHPQKANQRAQRFYDVRLRDIIEPRKSSIQKQLLGRAPEIGLTGHYQALQGLEANEAFLAPDQATRIAHQAGYDSLSDFYSAVDKEHGGRLASAFFREPVLGRESGMAAVNLVTPNYLMGKGLKPEEIPSGAGGTGVVYLNSVLANMFSGDLDLDPMGLLVAATRGKDGVLQTIRDTNMQKELSQSPRDYYLNMKKSLFGLYGPESDHYDIIRKEAEAMMLPAGIEGGKGTLFAEAVKSNADLQRLPLSRLSEGLAKKALNDRIKGTAYSAGRKLEAFFLAGSEPAGPEREAAVEMAMDRNRLQLAGALSSSYGMEQGGTAWSANRAVTAIASIYQPGLDNEVPFAKGASNLESALGSSTFRLDDAGNTQFMFRPSAEVTQVKDLSGLDVKRGGWAVTYNSGDAGTEPAGSAGILHEEFKRLTGNPRIRNEVLGLAFGADAASANKIYSELEKVQLDASLPEEARLAQYQQGRHNALLQLEQEGHITERAPLVRAMIGSAARRARAESQKPEEVRRLTPEEYVSMRYTYGGQKISLDELLAKPEIGVGLTLEDAMNQNLATSDEALINLAQAKGQFNAGASVISDVVNQFFAAVSPNSATSPAALLGLVAQRAQWRATDRAIADAGEYPFEQGPAPAVGATPAASGGGAQKPPSGGRTTTASPEAAGGRGQAENPYTGKPSANPRLAGRGGYAPPPKSIEAAMSQVQATYGALERYNAPDLLLTRPSELQETAAQLANVLIPGTDQTVDQKIAALNAMSDGTLTQRMNTLRGGQSGREGTLQMLGNLPTQGLRTAGRLAVEVDKARGNLMVAGMGSDTKEYQAIASATAGRYGGDNAAFGLVGRAGRQINETIRMEGIKASELAGGEGAAPLSDAHINQIHKATAALREAIKMQEEYGKTVSSGTASMEKRIAAEEKVQDSKHTAAVEAARLNVAEVAQKAGILGGVTGGWAEIKARIQQNMDDQAAGRIAPNAKGALDVGEALSKADQIEDAETKYKLAQQEARADRTPSGIFRKALSGFGLMYMRSLWNIGTEGLTTGYSERLQLDQSAYGAMGGVMGGASIAYNPENYLRAQQAGVGGVGNRAMQTLRADLTNPTSSMISGMGLGALSAYALSMQASSWGIAAAESLAAPAAIAVAAGVGAMNVYGAMQDTPGTSLALASMNAPGDVLKNLPQAAAYLFDQSYKDSSVMKALGYRSGNYDQTNQMIALRSQIEQGVPIDQALTRAGYNTPAARTEALAGMAKIKYGQDARLGLDQNAYMSNFAMMTKYGLDINSQDLRRAGTAYLQNGINPENLSMSMLSAAGWSVADQYGAGGRGTQIQQWLTDQNLSAQQQETYAAGIGIAGQMGDAWINLAREKGWSGTDLIEQYDKLGRDQGPLEGAYYAQLQKLRDQEKGLGLSPMDLGGSVGTRGSDWAPGVLSRGEQADLRLNLGMAGQRTGMVGDIRTRIGGMLGLSSQGAAAVAPNMDKWSVAQIGAYSQRVGMAATFQANQLQAGMDPWADTRRFLDPAKSSIGEVQRATGISELAQKYRQNMIEQWGIDPNRGERMEQAINGMSPRMATLMAQASAMDPMALMRLQSMGAPLEGMGQVPWWMVQGDVSGFGPTKGMATGQALFATSMNWGNPAFGGMDAQQVAGLAWGSNWAGRDTQMPLAGGGSQGFLSAMVNGTPLVGSRNPLDGNKPYMLGGMQALSYLQSNLQYSQAMASAGNQMAQWQQNYAFTTGVGLPAYAGIVNPQTGSPFGFNTGQWTVNMPTGGSFTSTGGGAWGLEDAQRALSNNQQQYQFGQQQRQMDLSNKYWEINTSLDRRGTLMQRGFTRQAWGYEDTRREQDWGWRQEDFQESVRFMTGRDRRLGERQMRRDTTVHNEEEQQINKTRAQQKQMWNLEDERFSVAKRQHAEEKQFQEEALQKQREYYEAGRNLQEEAIKMQRAGWIEQMELQKQSIGIAASAAQKQKDVADKMLELQVLQLELNTLVGTGMAGATDKIRERINKLLADLGLPPLGGGGGSGNGNGGGGNCFVAGTPIDTPLGTRAVETITIGQLVWAYDEHTHNRQRGVVVGTQIAPRDDLVTVTTSKGTYHCSPNHRWLTYEGWVEARDLQPDTWLVGPAESCVESVASYAGVHMVYNFEVERYHTYLVDGQVVHNVKVNPGAAAGGSFRAGETVTTSEFGPEVIRPQRDFSVVPAHLINPYSRTVISNAPAPTGGAAAPVAQVSIYIGNQYLGEFVIDTVQKEIHV